MVNLRTNILIFNYFFQVKPEANDLNIYNQNFKGLYCICQRPYPDPDSENTDEMIQCIVCEDWFHSKVFIFYIKIMNFNNLHSHILQHLGTKDMNPDDYSEMICSDCTSKLSFLPAYKHLIGKTLFIFHTILEITFFIFWASKLFLMEIE